MDFSQLYQPGDTREETFTVEERHTAYHIGSGDSRVLSTPSMISFMEQVSHRYLAGKLPGNMLSVGIEVNIRHLAATPVHALVVVRSELLEISKNRFLFQVTAHDDVEKIGEGQHRRAVVELEWFEKKAEEKRK
jgi:predicted thioesterase